jgi:hypothetical protein
MPKCAICDAEVENFGDDCNKCRDVVEQTLDDYDVEQNEGIHIAGVVMPKDPAPVPSDDDE